MMVAEPREWIAPAPVARRSTESLVEVRGLTKAYGRQPVLRGIDIDIERGQVTAIVGPNGAGKTTLNKSLLGLVHPDGGSIHFDGADVRDSIEHRARIGYMPQSPRFPEHSSARDLLALLGDLRGNERPRDEYLIKAFELQRFLDQPVRALSGGQRQRLNAAAAFLFTPDLLLLDEPTAGLDPVASGTLKERIRAVRDENRAVVITSHILSEVQELADQIVFLHEGRVAFAGALHTLQEQTGATSLERAIAQLMQSDALRANTRAPEAS